MLPVEKLVFPISVIIPSPLAIVDREGREPLRVCMLAVVVQSCVGLLCDLVRLLALLCFVQYLRVPSQEFSSRL